MRISVIGSLLLLSTVVAIAVPLGTEAQQSSGPAAYYGPNWDPVRIFYTHHGWGNTIPNATHPPYNGNYCVHPDYRPGTVLSITAPVGTTTCLVFDSVRVEHQPAWRAKWALEVSWNTFHRLGLNENNWVTVHGISNPSTVPEAVDEVADNVSSTQCFDETGYCIDGEFADFWNSNGAIPIFGYPMSDERVEDGITVQYFERAVFEFHPDNEGPYRVLLRRLGAKQLDG